MKPLKKYFAIALLLGLFIDVTAQEYDDMYFTKKDRKSKFTNEQYNESSSFASEEVAPVKISKEDDLASDSYSAKTINPDYIAKYKSDALDEGAEPGAQEEYYVEQQPIANNVTAAPVRNPYRQNNINSRWNWGMSYGMGFSPWNSWGYNPYNYWGPYSYSSLYLSSWYYNPYRFRGNGGWGTGWGQFYGDPYFNNFGGAGFGPGVPGTFTGSGFGVGFGGGLYCPPGYYGAPVVINNNFGRPGVNVDNRTNGRQVTVVNNGPRTSRNSTAAATQSGRQYRSTATGSSNGVSGYVPITSTTPNARTAVANPQGSYYRRANNPGTSVRGSQRSRVAVVSGQSLNEATTSGRSYTSNTRSNTAGRSAAAYNYNSGRGRSTAVNTSQRSTSRSTVGGRPASAATRSYSSSRNSSYRSRSNSSSRSSFGSRSSGTSSYSRSTSSGRSSSGSFSSSGGSRGSVSSGSSGRSSGGSSRSSGGGGRRGN